MVTTLSLSSHSVVTVQHSDWWNRSFAVYMYTLSYTLHCLSHISDDLMRSSKFPQKFLTKILTLVLTSLVYFPLAFCLSWISYLVASWQQHSFWHQHPWLWITTSIEYKGSLNSAISSPHSSQSAMTKSFRLIKFCEFTFAREVRQVKNNLKNTAKINYILKATISLMHHTLVSKGLQSRLGQFMHKIL